MKDKYGREMITVCDACLTASCWYGEFMCQASQGAGTVNLPIETLRGLGLEHEDYWHRDADGRPGKHRKVTIDYFDPDEEIPHIKVEKGIV